MSRRIEELDGLRGIAILLVLACHYKGYCMLWGGVFTAGWIGVDIFFALSGYLITSILLRLRGESHAIFSFYKRRTVRVFPLYYLCVLVLASVSLICGEKLVHAGYFVNRLFFLQSLLASPQLFHRAYSFVVHGVSLSPATSLPAASLGAPLGPWGNSLGAAWSLSIEEYFYILWAPIVLFVRSLRKIVAWAIFISIFSIMLRVMSFNGVGTYFDFACRLDSLMGGAFVAIAMTHNPASHKGIRYKDVMMALLPIGLVGFVLTLLQIRPILGRELRSSYLFSTVGLFFLELMISGLIALLLSKQKKLDPVGAMLRWRPLRLVGTISYGVYLFHIPVYYAMEHLVSWRRGSSLSDFCISFASTVIVFGLAYCSWQFFEQPLLKRFSSPERLAVAASS